MSFWDRQCHVMGVWTGLQTFQAGYQLMIASSCRAAQRFRSLSINDRIL